MEDAAKSILQTIQDTFAGGVQAEIPISLNTVTQYRAGNLTGTITKNIEHHASGGLMDKPTLSWFAEEARRWRNPDRWLESVNQFMAGDGPHAGGLRFWRDAEEFHGWYFE